MVRPAGREGRPADHRDLRVANGQTPGPCVNSLLLQRNGTHWTPVRLPSHTEVLGVVPFSATDALAIDGGENGTILGMRWNGKTWKWPPVPGQARLAYQPWPRYCRRCTALAR